MLLCYSYVKEGFLYITCPCKIVKVFFKIYMFVEELWNKYNKNSQGLHLVHMTMTNQQHQVECYAPFLWLQTEPHQKLLVQLCSQVLCWANWNNHILKYLFFTFSYFSYFCHWYTETFSRLFTDISTKLHTNHVYPCQSYYFYCWINWQIMDK